LRDLAKLVEDAWLDLASMREGREARIQQHSRGLALQCAVDPSRFGQVIRNALENSLAATSGAVEIQIRYAEAEIRGEPALCMAIRDNGPGLTPEGREKIFEAFYTTKSHGTGIGMAISKRIVERHGGQIAVGDVEGPGTEIVITLPRRKG
jgi:signal transduction histidine kinase